MSVGSLKKKWFCLCFKLKQNSRIIRRNDLRRNDFFFFVKIGI